MERKQEGMLSSTFGYLVYFDSALDRPQIKRIKELSSFFSPHRTIRKPLAPSIKILMRPVFDQLGAKWKHPPNTLLGLYSMIVLWGIVFAATGFACIVVAHHYGLVN